jgi:two-component system phosphate regulon response regulator PhoB
LSRPGDGPQLHFCFIPSSYGAGILRAGDAFVLSRQKVAVIEDEPDILELLTYNLAREGFTVVSADDGHRGLELVRREVPNIVVLDLLLPGLDGLEICRRLKQDTATRQIPIVMLTAKSEESDVVLGLGVGADDYVTKPFSPRELLARLRAVLRRGPLAVESHDRIVRDGLIIDPTSHRVVVDGGERTFTATEFRLLHFLASHPDRVFTREQLINRVIGHGAVVIDRNIDVHVRAVRKKLGPYRGLVETVRGVGYRFSGSTSGSASA